MNTIVESRREYRLLAEEAVFLQLACDLPGTNGAEALESPSILLSHSVDISASGLLMLLDEELPVGSIYPVCVVLQNPDVRFQLITEVKWALPENGQWRVGLAIFESEDTDIEEWKNLIEKRCNQ